MKLKDDGFLKYLLSRSKIHLDLGYMVFLDGVLTVFCTFVFRCVVSVVQYFNSTSLDNHTIETLRSRSHMALIVMFSIFLISDVIRTTIKCWKEIRHEWLKESN